MQPEPLSKHKNRTSGDQRTDWGAFHKATKGGGEGKLSQELWQFSQISNSSCNPPQSRYFFH